MHKEYSKKIDEDINPTLDASDSSYTQYDKMKTSKFSLNDELYSPRQTLVRLKTGASDLHVNQPDFLRVLQSLEY